MKKIIILTFIIFVTSTSFPQKAYSIEESNQYGISFDELNSIYKDAMNIDSSKAVFKTEREQNIMYQAYINLLQDLGKFLTKNNFKWDKPTRCFNRIYFNTEGKIDYFLFSFTGKDEDKPSQDKQKEFERLLNLFIQDYKIPLTAEIKFAQCSPVVYMPKDNDEKLSK